MSDFRSFFVNPNNIDNNYFITVPGNASGNVENAGENCGWIEYEDEIVEITIPCSGEYNFQISQDEFDPNYRFEQGLIH